MKRKIVILENFWHLSAPTSHTYIYNTFYYLFLFLFLFCWILSRLFLFAFVDFSFILGWMYTLLRNRKQLNWEKRLCRITYYFMALLKVCEAFSIHYFSSDLFYCSWVYMCISPFLSSKKKEAERERDILFFSVWSCKSLQELFFVLDFRVCSFES